MRPQPLAAVLVVLAAQLVPAALVDLVVLGALEVQAAQAVVVVQVVLAALVVQVDHHI